MLCVCVVSLWAASPSLLHRVLSVDLSALGLQSDGRLVVTQLSVEVMMFSRSSCVLWLTCRKLMGMSGGLFGMVQASQGH